MNSNTEEVIYTAILNLVEKHTKVEGSEFPTNNAIEKTRRCNASIRYERNNIRHDETRDQFFKEYSNGVLTNSTETWERRFEKENNLLTRHWKT